MIVLAGGDGSRLGFQGPKGCFVVPKLKKSLFELLVSKIASSSLEVRLAVMTSERNHSATVTWFDSHGYFGLDPSTCRFFMQDSLAVSSTCGHKMYQGSGQLLKAPSGNGNVFKAFNQSSIAVEWKQWGVEYIQIVPVDNPLAPVVDEAMLNVHSRYKVDLVVRAVVKKESEKMGQMVRQEGHLNVAEYTEESLPLQFHSLGYTGLCSWKASTFFCVKTLHESWHRAYKIIGSDRVIKFETFIFDYFKYAASFKVLVCEREAIFHPIKSEADISSIQIPQNYSILS